MAMSVLLLDRRDDGRIAYSAPWVPPPSTSSDSFVTILTVNDQARWGGTPIRRVSAAPARDCVLKRIGSRLGLDGDTQLGLICLARPGIHPRLSSDR